jgi:hypothetical protein
LLLARVGDSLEPTEACTSNGLAPKQASFPLDSTLQKSSLVVEDYLYGCISPRCSSCPSRQLDISPASESEGMDGILAPVLQITPELHELSEESFVVLPLEQGSLRPCHPLHRCWPPLWLVEECWRIALRHFFSKELCGLFISRLALDMARILPAS